MAYSLSKMYIPDEMEDFDRYNDLKMVEFYEFLGRLAHLLFPAETYGEGFPLVKKIENLL